jgi:hypothetical protein
MGSQEISIIIAACSALFSAISAGVNLWNTSTFRRQLKNTTIDSCVAASGALKAAVHKTIELKANKIDKITSEEIRGAYDDAWAKWVAFYQAFRIAQRYNKAFNVDAPDQTSRLLSELRVSLRDPNWNPGGVGDKRDIREEVDKIVNEIQRIGGLA